MGARHPLPYTFAKTNVLLLEDDGRELVLWAAETTPLAALAKLQRSVARCGPKLLNTAISTSATTTQRMTLRDIEFT